MGYPEQSAKRSGPVQKGGWRDRAGARECEQYEGNLGGGGVKRRREGEWVLQERVPRLV